VRNTQKGAKAKNDIEQDVGRFGVVEVWPLDLLSFESTRHFAVRVDSLHR
jgi:hypothetical protein